MPRRRRVPQRTCVCCGVKTDKRELTRIVSGPDSEIALDLTGKMNGRGAYVCDSCRGSTGTLRRRKLEYSLRTKIDENDWNALLKAMRSWPE